MSGFRPRFFVTDQPIVAAGVELTLDAGDSHHARAVLRLQPGDACEVVMGAAVYAATVSEVGDTVKVEVTSPRDTEPEGGDYQHDVGLVQALARPAVMDYVFEKGTEVGASFFVLVAAAGSPTWAASPPADRLQRWSRIAREAAKQSKRFSVPPVLFAGSAVEALTHEVVTGASSIVLEPGAAAELNDTLSRLAGRSERRRIALWVGPEGGWTHAELQQLNAGGSVTARLGRSVLRTETAGPVAIALARVALSDW